MKNKVGLAVLSLGILVGAVGGASPAQAAVSVVSSYTSPSPMIVNGDATQVWGRTYVKLYDPDSDVSTSDFSQKWCTGCIWYISSRSGGYATFYTKWWIDGRFGVGSSTSVVDINFYDYDLGGNRELHVSSVLTVKRPTQLTMNATPEPVVSGSKVKIAGRLLIDPVSPGSYYGPTGTPVRLYWKRSGTSSYVYVSTAYTSKGYYSFSKTQKYSGTWQVRYAGSSTKQARTLSDSVAVS